MMKVKHTLSLLALAAATAFSTSAMAQSVGGQGATVTIVGGISAQICDVVVNGQRASTITLPQATVAQLPRVGSTTGDQAFRVELKDCAPSVNEAQVNFSSADANTQGRIDSGVGGVSVQVLTNGQQVTATSQASENINRADYVAQVNNGGATLNYVARYYREGAISPGDVRATAQLTVAYL